MSLVLFAKENQIARITLNCPENLNSFSEELVGELTDVFSQAMKSDARLVVFQASGKGFSGGFDLSDINQSSDGDLVLRLIRVEQLLQEIHYSSIATLAFVRGPCYGAAAELVASCLWRVAAPNARFCMPGSHFGLVLGSRRLTDLVGEGGFRQLVFREESFDANEALESGFLTHIYEEAGWPKIEEDIVARLGKVDALTFSRILSQQRGDRRDSDLAELARSASHGSIKSRILMYVSKISDKKTQKT